jgi:hypothetical protein
MSTYAWFTDSHLDHLKDDASRLIAFGQSLVKDNPTGIFCSGDLTVSRKLIYHLSALERITQRPFYFVLGNHDYYGGQIESVRQGMRYLSTSSQHLRYMPTTPYVSLSSNTALIGHDCWYDAMYGDWKTSNCYMNDWTEIVDFQLVNGAKSTIVARARELAHAGVEHIQNGIKGAVKYHKSIIVLTHYVPFEAAHTFEGKLADKSYAPFYTCKMLGDMLIDAAKAYPNVNFNVLCGHTHSSWNGKITANLECHVGGTQYNDPIVNGLIEVA